MPLSCISTTEYDFDTDASTHYVFAHIDQTTVNVTGRFNYTITPTLSLQLYAQPFVSAGVYTGFKEVNDPLSESYENRYKPFDYSGAQYSNPDFNVKSPVRTECSRRCATSASLAMHSG